MPVGQDPDPLDGYAVLDVADEAVDVFDAADLAGQQVSVLSLPAVDDQELDPFRASQPDDSVEVGEPLPPPETVTASAVSIVPILSRDDVPRAITAAVKDPSARWYVERRLKALKLSDEFDLPWKN